MLCEHSDLDEAMKELADHGLDSASGAAVAAGMRTMLRNGFAKIMPGETTVGDVMRAVAARRVSSASKGREP